MNDINDFMKDYFNDIKDDLLISELLKMIIDTTKDCGKSSGIEDNEKFKNLIATLCVFGISLDDEEVRCKFNEVFDFTENRVNGNLHKNTEERKMINGQKWWEN